MTSATERLRALLDERGVEWWEEDGHTLWYGESLHHAASAFSSFLFGENKLVHLNAMVTPEQAIDATLGPGTCRALDGESSSGAPLQAGDYDEFWEPAGVCSECGELIPLRNYCPNCGRKVVDA